MAPKILAGLGCAGLVVFGLVLAVSLALPLATNGRTSWDEAMLGIVPGAACTSLSFLLLAGGLVWMFATRGRKQG